MWWFKKKGPEEKGMDKHTRRHLNEQYLHYEDFSFGRAIQCIEESNGYDDYLASAIDYTFTDEQRQYLKTRMWDKQYGRG